LKPVSRFYKKKTSKFLVKKLQKPRFNKKNPQILKNAPTSIFVKNPKNLKLWDICTTWGFAE